MFGQDTGLSDFELCILAFVLWIPNGLNFVATCSFQPKLSPFSKSEILGLEMIFHDIDEIVQGGIIPFKFMEILSKGFGETLF